MTLNILEDTSSELARLLNGDERAFRALVKSHHSLLVGVARSIIGETLAEEVAQEAWVAIYDNLNRFEQKSSLKTWMCKITLNKAISRLRQESKHKRVQGLDDSMTSDDAFSRRFTSDGGWRSPLGEWEENNPERILTRQELQECIDEVMAGLPAKQRMVFSLSQLEGEKTDDVCNLVEVSTSNMKVLLHRARLKLFSHIAKFQETGEC